MDTLLLYTHHSVGIGHLMRSLSIARALARHFRIVVVCGGRIPDFDCQPPGVEMVSLPYLIISQQGSWIAPDGDTAQRMLAERQRILLETFERVRPAVVVIEFFPFGRMQYASELLALLEKARWSADRPLIISSIRDLLERRREHQLIYDDLASVLCNHLYDAVLVHSDPKFIRFEESFLPSVPMRAPLHYTGYVQPYSATLPADPEVNVENGMVVSCGGGHGHARELLQTALQAYLEHLQHHQLPLLLLGGQFIPKPEWDSLQDAVAAAPGVQLRRWVSNLSSVLRQAAVSVSQFGYNTFLDIVASGVPAVVVPYESPLDEEQVQRATRMERLKAIRLVPFKELSPERLANEIEAALHSSARQFSIDVNGATRTAEIIYGLYAERKQKQLCGQAVPALEIA